MSTSEERARHAVQSTVVLQGWQCMRCNAVWASRPPSWKRKPKKCPRCHSARWDSPPTRRGGEE